MTAVSSAPMFLHAQPPGDAAVPAPTLALVEPRRPVQAPAMLPPHAQTAAELAVAARARAKLLQEQAVARAQELEEQHRAGLRQLTELQQQAAAAMEEARRQQAAAYQQAAAALAAGGAAALAVAARAEQTAPAAMPLLGPGVEAGSAAAPRRLTLPAGYAAAAAGASAAPPPAAVPLAAATQGEGASRPQSAPMLPEQQAAPSPPEML